MIRQEERQRRMAHIEAACQAGARRAPACVLAGIDARTYQRWQADADRRGDGRPMAERPKPAHALSETERAEILAVANEPRFAELPPARIVPALADEGSYIASESSFYRVLRAHHQIRHRGRAHAPTAAPKPPTTHHATRPRQVWCWDMTYLPTAVLGQWFYLYLILDLYSRKIVGFTVEANDHSDHAAHLLRRTALAEGIHALADKPVLHGDNGATLKATTVLAMLHWLGLKPSYSRPRVSNVSVHPPTCIPPEKRSTLWIFDRGQRDGESGGTGSVVATACGSVASERRHAAGVLRGPRIESCLAQLGA